MNSEQTFQSKNQLRALKVHAFIERIENAVFGPIRKFFDVNTRAFEERKVSLTVVK